MERPTRNRKQRKQDDFHYYGLFSSQKEKNDSAKCEVKCKDSSVPIDSEFSEVGNNTPTTHFTDASTAINFETIEYSISDTIEFNYHETKTSIQHNGGASTSGNFEMRVTPETKDQSASFEVEPNSVIEAKVPGEVDTFAQAIMKVPFDTDDLPTALNSKLKNITVFANMKQFFKKIGGRDSTKHVNNILNKIFTKKLQSELFWDPKNPKSIQNFRMIMKCIYEAVDSKEDIVNGIIKNTLRNARAKLLKEPFGDTF